MERFTRRFGFKVAAALGAAAAAGNLTSVAFAEKVPVGEPADIAEASVGGDLIVRVVELGDNMDPAKTASLQSGITLRLVGDTLIAKDTGNGTYRFDIRLQGEGETIFLDV